MKRFVWITAIVLGTLTAVVAAWKLRVVLLVFLFSLWTAAAVRPTVDFLNGHGLRRGLALALTYLLGLSVLVALALLLISPLTSELQKLGNDAVTGFEQITKRWENGTRLEQMIVRTLPVPEHVIEGLASNQGWMALRSLLGFTFGLFDTAVHLVIVVVLSLYWSIDRVHFERLWLSLLSVGQRGEARAIWRDIEAEVGGYLRSEAVQCIAAGVLLTGGYYVLGYPYPVLMAVIAAVCWLIPFLGVLFALVIALLLAVPTVVTANSSDALVRTAAAALITVAVLLVLELWVEPRLFRRQRYNSLLTVIVVVALADVFGIVGLVLGPPVAAAMQIIGRHLLQRQVAAGSSGRTEHLPTLDERLTAVRAALASMPEPAPGLVNLVHRLEELVGETHEVARQVQGAPVAVVYVSESDMAAG